MGMESIFKHFEEDTIQKGISISRKMKIGRISSTDITIPSTVTEIGKNALTLPKLHAITSGER